MDMTHADLPTGDSSSGGRRFRAVVTASVIASGTLFTSAASAQESSTSPTAESTIGGALLGAEAGTLVESLAGVHSPWVYALSDVGLSGIGAIGGYEVQEHSSNAQVPVFIIAVGLGLMIPAVILTWNATTQYLPNEAPLPTTEPAAVPATGASPRPAPRSEPAPATSSASGVTLPPSLLDVSGAAMHLGLPVPEIRPTFSMNELRQYGLTQQTEVRMSLVKLAF